MSAKLFKVSIAFAIYVVAESEDDALDVAEDHASEELDNRPIGDRVESIDEVSRVDFIDAEWQDAIPYYADDLEDIDMTCRKFMEGAEAGQGMVRAKADLPGQGLLFGGEAKS